jgi:hypothetical protein
MLLTDHSVVGALAADDLATLERSRWEVSLELRHGRLDKVIELCFFVLAID